MKMNLDLGNDLSYSNSIVNYLNSSYQGRFAYYNVLSQLQSELFDQGKLDETKEATEQIAGWVKDLKKGLCLFNMNWTMPKTFASEEALKLLKALRPELNDLAEKINVLLAGGTFAQDDAGIRMLISAFCRYAYTRDNYMRGLVSFGEIFQRQDIVDLYTPMLEGCAQRVELAHSFLNEYKTATELTKDYLLNLGFHAIRLPGTFRSQVHDINLLMVNFEGALTFEKMEISPEEASDWKQLKTKPAAAGYWRAFGIGPEEALAWSQAGAIQHHEAVEWGMRGFTPVMAAPWLAYRIPPEIAVQWGAAGFEAAEAFEHLQHGTMDPEEAKRDPLEKFATKEEPQSEEEEEVEEDYGSDD